MDDVTLLSWLERGQNITALLVAIGVAGEFLLGFMAGPVRKRIDDAQKADVARLTAEMANANERAANAELELARIKSPRSLTNVPEVIAALSLFPGTEYVFSGVGADQDSLTLIRQIDDVLQKAKWRRQPAHGRFPAINVFEPNNADQSVSQALLSGVLVSVDSPEGLAGIQNKEVKDLPEYVRAAISLTLDIGSNLYPPQENPKAVDVQKGNSTVIRITVGHKP